MRFLENTLLASIMAAFARGPKARLPSLSNLSTSPIAKGSSGATTVSSISSCAFTNSTILSRSIAFISGRHSASSAMPALPGMQYSLPTCGLLARAYAMACSLPPPPTTNTLCFIWFPFCVTRKVCVFSHEWDCRVGLRPPRNDREIPQGIAASGYALLAMTRVTRRRRRRAVQIRTTGAVPARERTSRT